MSHTRKLAYIPMPVAVVLVDGEIVEVHAPTTGLAHGRYYAFGLYPTMESAEKAMADVLEPSPPVHESKLESV